MDLFFDEDALAADFGMEPGVAKAPARAPAQPAPWGMDGSKKAPKKKGLKGQITAFRLKTYCLWAPEWADRQRYHPKRANLALHRPGSLEKVLRSVSWSIADCKSFDGRRGDAVCRQTCQVGGRGQGAQVHAAAVLSEGAACSSTV